MHHLGTSERVKIVQSVLEHLALYRSFHHLKEVQWKKLGLEGLSLNKSLLSGSSEDT